MNKQLSGKNLVFEKAVNVLSRKVEKSIFKIIFSFHQGKNCVIQMNVIYEYLHSWITIQISAAELIIVENYMKGKRLSDVNLDDVKIINDYCVIVEKTGRIQYQSGAL
jgi:hypothetical protein